MQHFGQFFSKLQKLVPPQRLQKEAIIVAVKELAQLELTLEHIKITRGTVYLPKTLSAAARSQIFIKQQDILAKVGELVPTQRPPDRIL